MKKIILYTIAVKILLFTLSGSLFAQTIRGTVKAGVNGDPLPGVNVLIKGTATGATTDVSGNYQLSATVGVTITLSCSVVGYTTIEKTITPVTGTNYVNFWFDPPLPSATISGTTTVCRNTSPPNITFTGSNGTAPYTFTYRINSGSNQTISTTTLNSITVSVPTTTAGTFTYSLVSVMDQNTTAGAIGSAVVTINALPATPTITAGSSTRFCTGGSVTLTSSSGTNYFWSTGANTSSITIATTGNYTVQVSNTSGCVSAVSAATPVTVDPQPATPTITPGGSTTFCAGGSVTLTSSTGTSYLWTNGATTGSINVTTAGSYSVRVTDASGCQSAMPPAMPVTVNPLPSAPSTGTITQPTCVLSTGSVLLNGLPGTGTWTLTRSPGGITTTGAGPSSTISGLASGTYTFTVTNEPGCKSQASANVMIATAMIGVIPKIKAKWGDVLICSNLGDSISSYQWYKNNSAISNATKQFFAADKQSGGVYKVETIDKNGCKNSSNTISVSGTKSISVYPNPASVNFSLKINDEYEGKAKIRIINSSGIKIMEFETEKINGEMVKEVPVSNFDEGIYIIQVLLDQKEMYFTKIVVKK